MKKFNPKFSITALIAQSLMQIEAVKQEILTLPVAQIVLESLRETARLVSTHYSTMIEGNRLTQEQVIQVLQEREHFPGRERDENEVKGHYAALDMVEKYAAQGELITEKMIRMLHALVMNNGKTRVNPTPYRDGQNVIREGGTRRIVYLPPEACDVADLMKALVIWINEQEALPAPIVAAVAHYQFATIHPYYDGNGRTARLLATLILHKRGYDLKGIYSLDEYYARDLNAYYQALSVGPSHNYYEGRALAEISHWIDYFCAGMAQACHKVRNQAYQALQRGVPDQSPLLRRLDVKQRRALELFAKYQVVTSQQIGELFGFKPRTSSELCRCWVQSGFLVIVDQSRKSRKYQLAPLYQTLLNEVNFKNN